MKEEFKRIARALFEKGLMDSEGGSLSVRVGEKIYITKRSARMFDLSEEDILETGLEGGEDREAAPELLNHRAIYRETGKKAIIQAHPAYAISAAAQDEKIIPQDALGKALLRSIPVIRAREVVASQEVTKFLAPAFKSGYSAALVRGYCSFAAGEDLFEALRLTEQVERSSKIAYLIKLASQPRPAVHHHKPRREESRRAIPPGIGVMGRDRERGRYKSR